MKNAANYGGGTEIGRDEIEMNKNNWGTDLNVGACSGAFFLNETARFLQNDAVSYIKKRGPNGVVLNGIVHLSSSLPPRTGSGEEGKIKLI